MFISVLFTITKIWKQPKSPSVDEWAKQLWDIYTMEFYLDIKKKKILPFATVLTDPENIMLSEVTQSKKGKCHMISLICGIKWTNWSNKENEDRLIDGEQMTAGGDGMERRDWAKRKKDSWTRTTVWWLLRGEGIKGVKGNGKNTINIKSKMIYYEMWKIKN